MVGEDAHLSANYLIGPDYGFGTGASLGPGVVLLERTRLPGKQSPAMVDAGAKMRGGAIVTGVKVGVVAVVVSGEVVEDDEPDRPVWMGGRVFSLMNGKT